MQVGHGAAEVPADRGLVGDPAPGPVGAEERALQQVLGLVAVTGEVVRRGVQGGAALAHVRGELRDVVLRDGRVLPLRVSLSRLGGAGRGGVQPQQRRTGGLTTGRLPRADRPQTASLFPRGVLALDADGEDPRSVRVPAESAAFPTRPIPYSSPALAPPLTRRATGFPPVLCAHPRTVTAPEFSSVLTSYRVRVVVADERAVRTAGLVRV